MYNVKFLDKSIDVVKLGTRFEVFDDRCPHRGAKLSHGVVDGVENCLTCPYHGMKFDLDAGSCVGFLGDYPAGKVKAKLCKHNTKSFDTLVWGYFGEGHPPEFMPERLNLDQVGTDEEFHSIFGQRDINCNVFEVEENLLDNIHISVVHAWGNPESLPVNTIKSDRGNFFFYNHGTNSMASWLDDDKSNYVTVYNGFAEPLSTLSRVCFGAGMTKSVRVHLLPLGENKTRMFWGLHRNFLKAWWLDGVFRFLIEKTVDEDKVIVENLASKTFKQTLTEFDSVIVQYRKRMTSYVEHDKKDNK